MKNLNIKEKFELWMVINGLEYVDFLWLAFCVGILIWLVL